MEHEGLCISPRDIWSKLKQIMRKKERMREIERERERERKGLGAVGDGERDTAATN